MSVQKQHIKRPVHRVPARIAFALAGVFVLVGLAGAPAFYAFAAFSALCGFIWALGGGADHPTHHLSDDQPFPGRMDARSELRYGKAMNITGN